MEKFYDSETGCCKRFNPKPWKDTTVTLKNRLFVKDHVFCLFHVPIGFGKVMVRSVEKIFKAKAAPKDPLMLYSSSSPFGADLYIEVTKELPNSKMQRISGTFLSKVFEGHYKESGKWVKEMKKYADSKGKKIKKIYFFYTTCPSCAKVYGKNYTVLLAQI